MSWTDRAEIATLARLLPVRRHLGMLSTPSTILRWHRQINARRWTTQPARPGRPAIPAGVRALVLRLATENPTWDYRRIHGGPRRTRPSDRHFARLEDPGQRRHQPLTRRAGPSCTEFLRAPAHGILACELFHLDTMTLHRLYVFFFVIEHATAYTSSASPRTPPVPG